MKFKVKAIFVAKDLPLEIIKRILAGNKLLYSDRKEIVFSLRKDSYIFAYSFGSMIFLNVKDEIINTFLNKLVNMSIDILPEKVRDKYDEIYTITKSRKNAVEFEAVKLNTINLQSLRVIAWVLARSVALEYYEDVVTALVNQFASLNKTLSEKGKIKANKKKVLKIIGAHNLVIEAIISKMALLEEPLVTWEEEELDIVFNQLYDMFELDERLETIEYKLNYLQSNTNVFLEAVRYNMEIWLEATIVVLILIEIFIWLYEIFLM